MESGIYCVHLLNLSCAFLLSLVSYFFLVAHLWLQVGGWVSGNYCVFYAMGCESNFLFSWQFCPDEIFSRGDQSSTSELVCLPDTRHYNYHTMDFFLFPSFFFLFGLPTYRGRVGKWVFLSLFHSEICRFLMKYFLDLMKVPFRTSTFVMLLAHLFFVISDLKCCSSFLVASILGSLPPSYFPLLPFQVVYPHITFCL